MEKRISVKRTYLFARHFAFGALANWVANGRAGRIIALPLALRMALWCVIVLVLAEKRVEKDGIPVH